MFSAFPSSQRVRRTPELWARRISRRGTALILVLLMTVTLAAIAMSAILLTGSGGMIGRYYDRERDFRYAAEASLQMGKARLLRDTTVHLPDTGYVTLISGGSIKGADGITIPNVKVNLYAGLSGNTTGQFGQFASVVAEAYDAGGTRYVRRLEMQAENFARYAMFTDTWPGGLCYSTGEFIAGRAHSNQNWGSCGSPKYFDTVSAVGSVGGGSPTYVKGKINGAPYIPIPPVSRLASLHTHAVDGNLDVVAQGNDLSSVRTRIEFTAVDLNNDGDINDDAEGFIRVYQAQGVSSSAARLRSSLQFGAPSKEAPEDSLCGDFHVDATGRSRFYPIWTHNQAWFKNLFTAAQFAALNDDFAGTIGPDDRDQIMSNPSFRCYMSGDAHLVASERRLVLPAAARVATDWQKGGEDSTLTDSTEYGYWQKWAGDDAAAQLALNGTNGTKYEQWGKKHAIRLWPLYRTLNPNSKGVIHVHGPVLLSGILRGRVTVYAATEGTRIGQVGYGDDLVYSQDPASVTCANLLGVISDDDQLIIDNAINSPQRAGNGSGGYKYRFTDGDDNGMTTSHDFVLHGVTMSRQGTVGVEHFNIRQEGIGPCNAANSGRGCIRQAGGVIESVISATYSNNGDGFGENRSVDICLNTMSPPYFPTTGRYMDNRFYEIDPARYNITTLFQSLQGGF